MSSFGKIAATFGLALTLLGGNIRAQSVEYQFTFEFNSRTQLDSLSQIVSIDRVDGNRAWAYANADEMAVFAQTGIGFELCPAKNTEKAIPMATKVAQMQNIDRYPIYEVYDSLMHNFERDYPQLCKLEVVTTLASGRQILAVKISNNVELDNTDKPEVLCTATMHGDEGICATTALSLCRHLLSSYGTDKLVSRLLDSVEFWIIPIMNPDGMYNGGNNSISGSTRSNGSGYDLNRNFPKVNGGGNTRQPETTAMMEFFGRHHFSLSTNLHGGSECFNYPWDTWSRTTADDDWWRVVGAAYRDTTRNHGQSGFWLTNGYAWYSVSGGQQDWANYFAHCREVTIEVCNTKEPSSTTTIANIWQYHKNALLNFYAESLNGVRGRVINAAGEPITARITIAGHDKDNSWIETDTRVGDYHRFLKAGTYNLTFEAEDYETKTIENVVVTDGQPTWLDVVMETGRPQLSVSNSTFEIALPGASTTQRQIVVANIGKTHNSYSMTTDNAEWLTFNKTGKSLPKGQTDTITATFSSRWIADGQYTSVVRFESVSQTITVNFKLTVNSNPVEMTMTQQPLKFCYSIGDSLDLSGAAIELKYCNDSTSTIALTNSMP